jgi:hypothetical protein
LHRLFWGILLWRMCATVSAIGFIASLPLGGEA